jgi:hypothetical protein
MKTIAFYLVSLCAILFLSIPICNGQNNSRNIFDAKNFGIEISEKDFIQHVDTCIKIMKSVDTIKVQTYMITNEIEIQTYIEMARLHNTINANNLFNEQDIYKEFERLFIPDFALLACFMLETRPSKGGCEYSSKYDIYFGGMPHDRSMYKIKREK